MAYLIRRLQRMDLTFFHAHGAGGRSRQRAINVDKWVLPAIAPVPSQVTIRYRDVDDKMVRLATRRFGKLQKNYRLHGQMVPGAGYGRYRPGDLMMLRVIDGRFTWSIFQDDGEEARIHAFLNSPANVTWQGNMGLVEEPLRIRRLEVLLARYDPELYFATDLDGMDEGPRSTALRRSLRRSMSPIAFEALQRAWERNGAAGELAALGYERARLISLRRPDLAAQVEHVSAADATAPYDIRSFEGISPKPDMQRFIEVKATSGTGMEFEMSDAEWQFAEEKRYQHVLLRVTRVLSASPEYYEVRDIVGRFLEDERIRRPIAFRVKIR